MAVYLYEAETRRTTVTTTKRIQTFVNSSLRRRILGVWWPEIISNERLWQRTCQMPCARNEESPGETMEMDWSHFPQASRQHYTTSLSLESTGERKIGRPRNTWRHDQDADVKETGYSCRQLDNLSQDWNPWRNVVGTLCPRSGDEIG